LARRTPFTLATRAVPRLALRPENTALIVQDMQGYFTDPDRGLGRTASERGISREFNSYFEQLDVAKDNIALLVEEFRPRGIPVVFTRWAYEELRDLSPLQRGIGASIAADSPEAELAPGLELAPGDALVTKTGLGAFSTPRFEEELAARRVENLLLTGVITEFGIRSTALAAIDRGYRVIVVGDSCAGITLETHRNAISELTFGIMKVRSTGEILRYAEGLDREDLILV